MQGDDVNEANGILRNFHQTAVVETLSIYARSNTNVLVRLARGSYGTLHAKLDISNGNITTQVSESVSATIMPGPNGIYRCSLTIAGSLARSFLIYLIKSSNLERSPRN